MSSYNGPPDPGHCHFSRQSETLVFESLKRQEAQMEMITQTLVGLSKESQRSGEWIRSYIDRSMPMRSHFIILFGSLSILSGFAVAIKYGEKFIDKL